MLREPDAFDSRISFAHLETSDEGPEFRVVDLVAGGKKRRPRADELNVGVQADLNLMSRLVRVGQKCGLPAIFGGRSRVNRRENRKRARDRYQQIRHPSSQSDPTPSGRTEASHRRFVPFSVRLGCRGLARLLRRKPDAVQK